MKAPLRINKEFAGTMMTLLELLRLAASLVGLQKLQIRIARKQDILMDSMYGTRYRKVY